MSEISDACLEESPAPAEGWEFADYVLFCRVKAVAFGQIKYRLGDDWYYYFVANFYWQIRFVIYIVFNFKVGT